MDEFELSLGEVSERVGRSKPAVSNKLRLLELPDDVLAMVERGELSEGHARAVLAVPDQAERRKLARKIVAQGMSVRAAERARSLVGRAHEAADEDARRSRARGSASSSALAAADRPRGAESRSARSSSRYADELDLEQLAEVLEARDLSAREPGDVSRCRAPASHVLDESLTGAAADAAAHAGSRMGDRGFEPRTSALSERRSNQLS